MATVEGAEDGPAWERRKELGFVKALLETWKEVLFNPAVSFSRMKTTGGYATPFLFNLTMVVIYAFFTTIYQLLFNGMVGGAAAAATHDGSTSMSGLGSWVTPIRQYWGDGGGGTAACRYSPSLMPGLRTSAWRSSKERPKATKPLIG